MSDIIYTPPASSGGGQNPTTNYIPLNNGTSNFVDSNIFNDLNNNILKSVFNGADYGLKLDFANGIFYFGDFDNAQNKTLLSIDDPNANIFLGNLAADTSGYRYNYLGNGGNNLFHLEVGCYPKGIGLFIDYQNNPTYDYLQLYSNGQTSIFSNNNQPLSLKALGTNNNQFILDPVTDKMTFTTGNLNFVGAGLLSNTAGGSSGKHLVVTIQGTTYKIALNNI